MGQVCSLWCRAHNEGVSAPCTRARPSCLPCGDPARTERTSGRSRSRQPSSGYKVRANSALILLPTTSNTALCLGFLFFGTITHVEETIRTLVEGAAWQRNPVRFLILDLALVAGVDMSAAEAFVRVQRILAARRVVLVFCGFSLESSVGRSLRNVDLLEMDGVELFATFNDALECESCSSLLSQAEYLIGERPGTENVYLRTWFSSQKTETHAVGEFVCVRLSETHAQ